MRVDLWLWANWFIKLTNTHWFCHTLENTERTLLVFWGLIYSLISVCSLFCVLGNFVKSFRNWKDQPLSKVKRWRHGCNGKLCVLTFMRIFPVTQTANLNIIADVNGIHGIQHKDGKNTCFHLQDRILKGTMGYLWNLTETWGKPQGTLAEHREIFGQFLWSLWQY